MRCWCTCLHDVNNDRALLTALMSTQRPLQQLVNTVRLGDVTPARQRVALVNGNRFRGIRSASARRIRPHLEPTSRAQDDQFAGHKDTDMNFRAAVGPRV